MSARAEAYQTVGELEAFLGDPADEANELSFAKILALDEAAAFPAGALSTLERFRLGSRYVPRRCGGGFKSVEELVLLARTLARRDLTVGVAHGKTMLGSVPVWLAGEEPQQKWLGERVCRGEPISLALTEREHGSDLLATQTTAERRGDHYVLNGEKWLINNATRCRAATVLARTDPRGGPRGFSLFLVDREALGAGMYEPLPEIRTHGVRGANISGLRLCDAAVPLASLVGKEGRGFEIILRALQVTRLLCAGFALGALETGLRITVSFVDSRSLYGASATAIGPLRDGLARSFARLTAFECLLSFCSRAAHVRTEQLSFLAAVAKAAIPTYVDRELGELARLLGARSFLREGEAALFQKIRRDVALVPIFDGSTPVNLSTIAQQLPRLGLDKPATPSLDAMRACSDPWAPLPAFDEKQLALLPKANVELLDLATSGALTAELPATTAPRLRELTTGIEREVRALGSRLAQAPRRPGLQIPDSSEAAVAERACALSTACAAISTWSTVGARLEGSFQNGEWLELVLGEILGLPDALAWSTRETFDELLERTRRRRSFGLLPLQLPDGGPA